VADEVIVNTNKWPEEFKWPLIGQRFQEGYELCTGDWVIHADLDFIFHEKDYEKLRFVLENYEHVPALSFWKYQFILPDRYLLKSRLVLAVNKKHFGKRIRFDSGNDLCQPSLDGEFIYPQYVPEARIAFYNYEKIAKTKAQIMNDQGRMERAYFRHFKAYQLSLDGSDGSAYAGWLKMMLGRLNKPSEHIKIEAHPKVMQQTILNLKPEQWGHSAFGIMESDYVKNSSYS